MVAHHDADGSVFEDGQELAERVGLDGDLGQERSGLPALAVGQAEVDLSLEQHAERAERVDCPGSSERGT